MSQICYHKRKHRSALRECTTGDHDCTLNNTPAFGSEGESDAGPPPGTSGRSGKGGLDESGVDANGVEAIGPEDGDMDGEETGLITEAGADAGTGVGVRTGDEDGVRTGEEDGAKKGGFVGDKEGMEAGTEAVQGACAGAGARTGLLAMGVGARRLWGEGGSGNDNGDGVMVLRNGDGDGALRGDDNGGVATFDT